MKFFKSAALVLVSASASMAFAPATIKTTASTNLLMSSDDNCDDRREFVSKVRFSVPLFSCNNERRQESAIVIDETLTLVDKDRNIMMKKII